MPGPRDTDAHQTTTSAEEGFVLLDGPAGAVIALTPEAALKIAEKLTCSAAVARGEGAVSRDEAPRA